MDKIIIAPFTPEQVDILNQFQKMGKFHPFTCGNPDRHKDGKHLDGDGILVATESGWKCQYCDYTQQWAHSFMVQQPSK